MYQNKTIALFKYNIVGLILLSGSLSFAKMMVGNHINDRFLKAPPVIKALPVVTLPVKSTPIVPNAALAHLEYFGYYASAFEGVGNGNYTKEISDHANLTWIVNGDVVKKLKEAKELNMKAIIDIQWIFMDENLQLRPDVIVRWKSFAKSIEPYQDTIAALYPLDEPYLNGDKHRVNNATIKANLETIASLTKSTFPEIPLAVIFTAKEVYHKKPIPTGFDWIGFDCYGKFKDCYKDHGVYYYYKKLQARLTGTQRIMLIPWAYKDGNVSQKDINARNSAAQDYWRLAKEKKVVAVIPFLYQSYIDTGGNGHHISGVQEMPTLRETFKSMGQEILRAHPNGVPRKSKLMQPNHNVIGYIDGVYAANNNWSVRGWACAQGITDSIYVDLYVGGALGAGGIGIVRYKANKSSEDGVSLACASIGSAYRFDISIDSKIANAYGGKSIFIYGISPTGGTNNSLIHSGVYRIPTTTSSVLINQKLRRNNILYEKKFSLKNH